MGKLSRFPKIGWVVSRSFSYNKWTCGFCPQTLQFDPPTMRHKRVTYLLIFFLNIFSEEDKSFEDSESIRWLLPPKLRVSLGMIIFHYAYVSTLILFIYMFHQYRNCPIARDIKIFPIHLPIRVSDWNKCQVFSRYYFQVFLFTLLYLSKS